MTQSQPARPHSRSAYLKPLLPRHPSSPPSRTTSRRTSPIRNAPSLKPRMRSPHDTLTSWIRPVNRAPLHRVTCTSRVSWTSSMRRTAQRCTSTSTEKRNPASQGISESIAIMGLFSRSPIRTWPGLGLALRMLTTKPEWRQIRWLFSRSRSSGVYPVSQLEGFTS